MTPERAESGRSDPGSHRASSSHAALDTVPAAGVPVVDAELTDEVRRFMTEHWRQPGFTCPNSATYPWLWLWDSCFHALIWARLGEGGRALSELDALLARQHADGFVPHVVYYDGFDGHRDFWGVAGTSSITQPPIFGHTIAQLVRSGVQVPGSIIRRARHAFGFLFDVRRRTAAGLVEMVHPWESGCDHSPRWDDVVVRPAQQVHGDAFDDTVWYRRKGELVGAIDRVEGSPVSSDECPVGSVAFNALIAFSARELADVTDDSDLEGDAAALSASLIDRWIPERRTWVDDGPTAAGSGSARTLEALLPLLTCPSRSVVDDVCEQLLDPAAFRGAYGLRQVHPSEATFDPGAYWRGASWPQLNYLFSLALRRHGRDEESRLVSALGLAGAKASQYSEYWNADDGSGRGAKPQSWAGLVII